MNKYQKKITNFIVITIFTLILSITWIPKSLGQISLFSTPNNNQQSPSPPWDLNKAYVCGKFWCSNVHIYDGKASTTTLLAPELTLAIFKNSNQSREEVVQEIEQRAKLVERVFGQILRRIINNTSIPRVPYISDWKFWLVTNEKDLHPWTPKVEVGFQNQQTVIYVPAQPELGLASQTIVTVTSNDTKANGGNFDELTQLWKNQIRISFSNGLWANEFDTQHPGGRWLISLATLCIAIILIYLIVLIRVFLRQSNYELMQKLKEITDSLAVDPEVNSSTREKQADKSEIDNLSDEDASVETLKTKRLLPSLKTKILNFIKNLRLTKYSLSSSSKIFREKSFLSSQTTIKQKINFCQLLLRLMLILEILIFSFALTIISLIFRETRFFSVYLLKETLILIILWMGLIFLDKLGDFAIDFYLNRWAKEAQRVNPSSNRYTLRVNTYSLTTKQVTTFFTIVLGIYLSIWLIGIDLSVLAGAGIITVSIAFLGRSLIEDMLNGILILCTDRYAIGDVIDVGGGMSGTVEDINLFITSLRNLDGQLIAIPNSKISSVINNTKYWSRVNFTIRIAWDQDIDKAIAVITDVAHEMKQEPEWGEKILEPAEMLGVDEVSHEGILLHLIIKTQPKEQWITGREFRRRVKQALDEAKISLGIPYHQISVIHSQKDSEQILSQIISPQEETNPETKK